MFRIRRIFDDLLPVNKHALEQVNSLLRRQFSDLEQYKIDRIPEVLRHPLKYGFRTILYVAEDQRHNLHGLALLDHDAELSFCFLDYLASHPGFSGRGAGRALYDRVRREALSLGVSGIFLECLPDDPALSRDPEIRKQNEKRLRFYERYGARPIAGTAYETPVTPGADNPPYLVYDGLGRKEPLEAAYLKRVVAGILEKKYGDLCTPEYVRKVLDSISENPVRLRPYRYAKARVVEERSARSTAELEKIALVVTDQHQVHHVHERGYVESPARIRAILPELLSTGAFLQIKPSHFSEEHIAAVHCREYLSYFKKVTREIPENVPLYPYVFPLRNRARPPVELPVRAGYYCMDTFTPISRQAYEAARRGVDCVLTAAREVLSGRKMAYALVRPPGHHAERGFFGGFCYFNNAAVAAHYLSAFGKVAILDLDYHHGNGQQDIFYSRSDVLTLSLHGHPRFAYPYFSGFADEKGEGEGRGYNYNYPLPEKAEGSLYLETLRKGLQEMRRFSPAYLVVCLGLDTARGDPTGTWSLGARDFTALGKAVGFLKVPSLVVQEGGYRIRSLGINCRSFLLGLRSGMEE
ncbi:MAG TPA: hypothetical protein PK364_03445 [Synergistaceae bacterium]|nr:hypothetical protein [Synergistaceae bacterium]